MTKRETKRETKRQRENEREKEKEGKKKEKTMKGWNRKGRVGDRIGSKARYRRGRDVKMNNR